MNSIFKLNGKKEIEGFSYENLQKVLKKNGCKTVKLGCSNGFCGNCMILLNDKPVPSCMLSIGMIQKNDDVVTLSYFQKNFPEAKDINKGFEKAGISLCGYCDAGKIFTAYDLIKKSRPSKEKIFAAIGSLNPCCTDIDTLCKGILFAYDFKLARKNKESKAEIEILKESEEETVGQKSDDTVMSETVKTETTNTYSTDDEKMIFPTTLQKLFEEIEKNPDCSILAGGTYKEPENEINEILNSQDENLAVKKNTKTIYLKKIPELNQIERHERYIEIGAAVPLSRIIDFPRIPQVLSESIKQIGSYAMRNLSTIGGNICIPDHKGGTWSALLALNAKFEISTSKDQKKLIKAHEFTTLGPKEVLTKIRIPINNWNISIYKKLGQSDSVFFDSAGFTFLAETEREHLYNIRIGFSGLGDLSQNDEILKHSTRPFGKKIKTNFCSDLIGQRLPLQEKNIKACLSDAEKIMNEKNIAGENPMIEQQFKILLRSALEKMI